MTPQYLGNKALLNKKLTAFFASRTVQTARVMACYDWVTGLSAETDCVVSGFQSAIERDVLHRWGYSIAITNPPPEAMWMSRVVVDVTCCVFAL